MKKKRYLRHLGTKELKITPDKFTKKLFQELDDEDCEVESTYKDEDFLKVDCMDARRSIDDLLLIYRTYLKGIHKQTILKSIERVILQPNKGCLLFCDEINKWVLYDAFTYDSDDEDYDEDYDDFEEDDEDDIKEKIKKYLYTQNYRGSNDEYKNKGKGTLSLENILNIMGHKNHLVVK